MKILRLEASNIKRVRVVEINPDGSLVLVTGRNAQGKSSVLDAIVYALGGKEAIPDKPLRNGADVGFIRLDLGDIVVERTFTADNTYLKVKAAGTNAEYPTPQKLLDGLFGKIAFDPLAFARMKARDQLGALLEVVDLGLDLDTLAVERKVLFDERTDVNRDVKRLEGALAGQQRYDDAPAALISAGDLAGEIAEGERSNGERMQAGNRIRQIETNIRELQQEEERLKAWHAASEHVDVNALKERLATIEADNEKCRANERYDDLKAELYTAMAGAANLNADIKAHDEKKAAALASATFPVPGLSFNEDGVLYDGRPLEQASSAELTRISTAVAMAANPKLKVVIIHDGSLLDDDNLGVIAEMAAANDYQIWIEKVDASGEVGVVIEDGQVVNAAVPATTAGKK
ncbi:MAG TPA: AAA family ATPase [bacterium]|nr:AAA family ATPase [bacterium]